MPLSGAINKLHKGQSLSTDEARAVFDIIFTGEAPDTQVGELLLRLHKKHETTDEIRGAVLSMRAKALTIEAPEGAIDIVGTGGDGRSSFNISTAAALIVAACGVTVAKHGNRASTSKSGSSDVLAALGLNLEPSLKRLEQCMAEANLCFLFAPRHHPSMRHVAAIRRKLGVRTIFNLLGPMTNPANVKNHLIGVYTSDWLRPMAEVLQSLGSRSAWLTHGQDGMDELTLSTTSDVVSLSGEDITAYNLSPEQAGLTPSPLEAIKGGDAAVNAAALIQLLDGAKGAYRDVALLNAAAALVIAGKVSYLKQGVSLGSQALDSGAARDRLRLLVEVTNRIDR
jgi:anthranilate phosphoribosyltransferase